MGQSSNVKIPGNIVLLLLCSLYSFKTVKLYESNLFRLVFLYYQFEKYEMLKSIVFFFFEID